MSAFSSSFCNGNLTHITSLNILTKIGSVNQKIQIIDSLGLTADASGNIILPGTINLNFFYNFWQSPINSFDVANIISVNIHNDKTSCDYASEYNNYLLQIFFCNITPDENFSPKLGGTDGTYITQLNNLHFYFTTQGGAGLGYCGNITEEPLLQKFCTAITPDGQNVSKFISGSPEYFKWCGCYAQQSEFAARFDPNLSIKEKLACNPMCNYEDSIKLYQEEESGSFYNEVECKETICVIDDISLRVINSQGNISFDQICKGCQDQSGNCLCIIDTSVKGILDKIVTGNGSSQNPASFKQVCPKTDCYSVNSDGVYTQLKCNSNNTAYTNQDPFFGYNGDGFLKDISSEDKLNDQNYLGIFFITVVLIIFLILAFIGLHDMDTQLKKQQNIRPKVKPKMSFELNPKYTPMQVNPNNKTKYAPLN